MDRRHRRPERRTHRPVVTVALALAMFLAAVESTIVATAMPAIVSALGGFSLFTWVFSIYLLTEAVSIPIYGKLADLYGRKPVFILGTSLFLLGTALCGRSNNMLQLIVYRGIQGLGSGAVLPIASTMIGDLYTLQERPRVQGALGSVWALAAVVGPALGGFIVDHLSWHWIFYINVPFGLISMVVLVFFLHEEVQRSGVKARVDYAGALLLVVGVAALILLLVQGGTSWPWTSPPAYGLALVALTGLLLFVLQERRAPEPLLPLQLLADRFILLSNLGALLGGGLILGLTSFVPTFAQGVLQTSATLGGMLLTVMSLGWSSASSLTGRAWNILGQRETAVLGGCCTLASGLLLASLRVGSPAWLLGVSSFIMGIGLGFTQTTFLVMIQSRVAWNQRGAATSANLFSRILGSTLWVALLGGIVNQRLHGFLVELRGLAPPGTLEVAAPVTRGGLDAVNLLLDAAAREQLGGPLLQQLREGLAHGIHGAFFILLLTGLGMVLIAWNLPRQGLARNGGN